MSCSEGQTIRTRSSGGAQDQRPVDGHEDEVQQHGGDDDENDVLEGLLHDLVMRGAQLDPHDDQQRAVVEQAHGHAVARNPPGDGRYCVSHGLRADKAWCSCITQLHSSEYVHLIVETAPIHGTNTEQRHINKIVVTPTLGSAERSRDTDVGNVCEGACR